MDDLVRALRAVLATGPPLRLAILFALARAGGPDRTATSTSRSSR